ncbi:MAG: hypothetical protein WBW69_06400 [Candidatus Korobacteraceae bacterium]
MLLHFIKLHWRTVLAVVVFAVAVWFVLPAGLRARISGRWSKIGHAIGNFQARILLTVIYSLLILPFGLVVRVFSDSMHMKKRPQKWFDHPPTPNTLEEARRQG